MHVLRVSVPFVVLYRLLPRLQRLGSLYGLGHVLLVHLLVETAIKDIVLDDFVVILLEEVGALLLLLQALLQLAQGVDAGVRNVRLGPWQLAGDL